ncbi:mucin-3A isoform X5 [Puntigrus tetrazona]|uniref:mucin-3A isoform X5 n=1 Tax=Puntigrus tetrazona TaxID=1606681 RepID=UPI001C8AD50D|nr:mucin-3A isoform X5 [Puntigrus tetrazona]
MTRISYTSSFILILGLSLISDFIERIASVTMEMNEPFKEDFTNQSSTEYRDFVRRFNNTVIPIYKKTVDKFSHVAHIILSAGRPLSQIRKRSLSLKETARLKVDHDVVLAIENNIEINSTYKNMVRDVIGVIADLINSSVPTFNVASGFATETVFSVNDVCLKVAEGFPSDYRDYFQPALLEGKVTCVTPCNAAHSDRIICENGGTCEVSSEGPSCYCRYTEEVWYLGEYCTLQVHKVGFYAGLGTVAVVAVITVAFLTAYLIMNKRTVKRNKDIKQELVKEWLEDDFEWPPQRETSNTDENGQTSDSDIF